MNIADRALAAHEANVQAQAAQKEANLLRNRAAAIDAIGRRADMIGIDVDLDTLELDNMTYGGLWSITLPVDTDATLVFRSRPRESGGVNVRVKVCDQLYWDLPPGVEEKQPGGGSYGCFNLHGIHDDEVTSLADLGSLLVRVRKAREMWRKKHCGKESA